MSKSAKLKISIVREDLYALTVSSLGARILAQFIYWMERTNDFDKFIREENERASANGDTPTLESTHGWIYKKTSELIKEIMIDESEVTVRRRISELVEIGWLEERRNPKYKWDKTLQYRVNLTLIVSDLAIIGMKLDGYHDFNVSNLHCEGSYIRDEGAIPEITTENTIQNTLTDEGANIAPPPPPVQSSVLPIEKAQPDTITANAVTTSPPIAPPPPTGKRKKSDGATTPKEPKPESVDMYQRWVRREYNPPTFCTSSQVELITNTVTDLPRWERTLSYWAKNAYRPNRVEDLLDAYSKDSGVIDQTRRDNFTRAAPKPQPGTEYDKAQKQPRLSQEEIQRRIKMAEEAERNLQ